ncbi:MAG: fibronectin type III domain-containing protein [Streptosporangiaceae bacterium]
MKMIFAGSRSLLLVVTLTVAAALCTVSTAHAASSAGETPVPAAPSNLTAKAAGPTSVQLTWTNNAANQSGVVISRDGVESVDLQGATVSSYTWSGLSPGTQYAFYVASKIYGTPGDPTGYGNTQSAWVGPVYATTSAAGSSPPPPPPLAKAVPNAGWAGYSAYPNNGDATGAWGYWVVPKITCPKGYPNARVAVWAGLFGSLASINSKTAWLPQIGTVSQCENGTAHYYLAWEMFSDVKGGGNGAQNTYAGYLAPSHCFGKIPGQAYYVCGTLPTGYIGGIGRVTVNPGDHVEALVYLNGSADQGSATRSFSITLNDFTGSNNGKYATGTITTNGFKVSLDSISRQGGVIVETSNPASEGLADFGTLTIGSAAVEQTGGSGGYGFYKWVMYAGTKKHLRMLADPGTSLKHTGSGEEVDYADTVRWKRFY